jgi:acyl-coenzyme A thioesterase PaaI-like protein
VRVGGRLAVADTTIENTEGKLCVRGTGTFVLFRGGG